MPIRAEYRKYYDARWRKFRLTMLEAAGNVCQMCHQPHRLLNVAPLAHDPADRPCLTVLCKRCHSKHNPAQRSARPRRTRARQRGQLWLSDELEVAPVPVRLWPLRLRQTCSGSPRIGNNFAFQAHPALETTSLSRLIPHWTILRISQGVAYQRYRFCSFPLALITRSGTPHGRWKFK